VPDRVTEVEEFSGSSDGAGEAPAVAAAAQIDKVVDKVPTNSAAAKSDPAPEAEVVPGPPPDPPALVVVKPIIAPSRASMSMQGGGERQLTGMKPIVPLRKRGQSFRETKNIVRTVDADGRRHLNQ
jgi:hypothetical protein